MKYNFDAIIPRENTNCYKYDLREKVFGNSSVIPLWVADMDFKVADEILADMNALISHGIFGYTYFNDSLYNSLINWNLKRNNWNIKKENIHFYHGVVPSINLIIQEFTQPNDSIIIQNPVYFPFFESIIQNNRKVIYNELLFTGSGYTMDFEKLEQQITPSTKMLLLCNPHNPVGRCWTKSELLQLHEICKKHNILVVSDEIHSDIILHNNKHIPWATLDGHASQNSITLAAPSKTFNIAGLSISAIICENEKINSQISKFIERNQLHGMSQINKAAFESAYTNGEPWLIELLQYLEQNLELIKDFITRNPILSLVEPEATYLAWINCKKLELSDKELYNFFVEKAGVGLSSGIQFGKGGEGFMRLNFACPKSLLEKALHQIEKALKSFKL